MSDLQGHFSSTITRNKEDIGRRRGEPAESKASSRQQEDEETTKDSLSASVKRMSAYLPRNFMQLMDLTLNEGEDERANSQSVEHEACAGFLRSRVHSPRNDDVDQFFGVRQHEDCASRDQNFRLDKQCKDHSPGSQNQKLDEAKEHHSRIKKDGLTQSPQNRKTKQSRPQKSDLAKSKEAFENSARSPQQSPQNQNTKRSSSLKSDSAKSKEAFENPARIRDGLDFGMQSLEILFKNFGAGQIPAVRAAGTDAQSVYYQALLLGLNDMKKKNLLPPEIVQKMPDLPGLPGPGGPTESDSSITNPLPGDVNAPGGPFPTEPHQPKGAGISQMFEGPPGSPAAPPGSPCFQEGRWHHVPRELYNGPCDLQQSSGRGSLAPAWSQESSESAVAWSVPCNGPLPAGYNGPLDLREPVPRPGSAPRRSGLLDPPRAGPAAYHNVYPTPSSTLHTKPQQFRNGPVHLMKQAKGGVIGVVRQPSGCDEKVVCEVNIVCYCVCYCQCVCVLVCVCV